MKRARRGYEHLRRFLVETFPFFVALIGTALILTLVFVVVAEQRQSAAVKELVLRAEREDSRQALRARRSLNEAKELLKNELSGHDDVQRQEHQRLLADIEKLLARPEGPTVVRVPALRSIPRSAPTTTTTDLRTETEVIQPPPTAPPAPSVCDRGRSCDKGKRK